MEEGDLIEVIGPSAKVYELQGQYTTPDHPSIRWVDQMDPYVGKKFFILSNDEDEDRIVLKYDTGNRVPYYWASGWLKLVNEDRVVEDEEEIFW